MNTFNTKPAPDGPLSGLSPEQVRTKLHKDTAIFLDSGNTITCIRKGYKAPKKTKAELRNLMQCMLPLWAVDAVLNGDLTHCTDKQINLIDSFLSRFAGWEHVVFSVIGVQGLTENLAFNDSGLNIELGIAVQVQVR